MSHLKDEMKWYDSVAPRDWESQASSTRIMVKGSVMDVACGTGDFSFWIRGDMNIACDLSRGMLLQAKKKNLDVIQAEVSSLPFREASLTAVSCFHALGEHIPLEKCLSQIVRSLKDEGLFAFTTIPKRHVLLKLLKYCVWRLGKKNDFALNRFSASESEVRALVRKHGLSEPKISMKKIPKFTHLYVETVKRCTAVRSK